MTWATGHIEQLKRGHTVQFRPRGRSMEPRVHSGALCTVEPIGDELPKKDEIVLCRVKGRDFLHLVKSVDRAVVADALYLIGNNRGGTNGWISRDFIFGRLTKVEP